MLFLLDFAKQAKFVVDAYEDEAEGVREKGSDGRMRMTRATADADPFRRRAHPERRGTGGDPSPNA
ncbi:MAG TPA: hypothetical protein VN715_17350 [Roseiarcus sp.]|nr:hypothetical protein [Roseiarcus sp.]